MAESKAKQRDLELGLSLAGILLLLITGIFWNFRQQQKRLALEQESVLKLQQERLRISRDLHDNLGAELTLIASSLDNLAYSAQAKTKDKLSEIGDNARFAMSQLRESIWAIRKESATLGDFASMVKQFTEKNQQQGTKLSVQVEGNQELVLSPGQLLNLYRSTQEAINNALKYADAQQIKVTVSTTENTLTIVIADSGKGFNRDQIQEGYGLQNMEARMLELEGTFEINSAVGKGTEVVLSVSV